MIKKTIIKLTPPLYTNKHEYVGGTNEKTRDSQTRESDDSPSDTDGCAINLDEEHMETNKSYGHTISVRG